MIVMTASPMAGRLTEVMRQARRHSGMSCILHLVRRTCGRRKKTRTRRGVGWCVRGGHRLTALRNRSSMPASSRPMAYPITGTSGDCLSTVGEYSHSISAISR